MLEGGGFRGIARFVEMVKDRGAETVTRSRVFHGVVRQDLQWFEEEMAGGL